MPDEPPVTIMCVPWRSIAAVTSAAVEVAVKGLMMRSCVIVLLSDRRLAGEGGG